jgi:hypothetical protein
LAESTPDIALGKDAAGYVCQMYDRVIDRGFYADVERNPRR